VIDRPVEDSGECGEIHRIVGRVIWLFEFRHRESNFLVTRVDDFAIGSTLKFNRLVGGNKCISLRALVIY